MIPLMLAAAATAAIPAQKSMAGTYQIHQMEMGGGLLLEKNGHFRFGLSYGAADEEAEGKWTFDGKTVRLTSDPMPRQPEFALVSDTPASPCKLNISVDWSKLDWSTAPDVLVTYAGDDRLHYLQGDENGDMHPEKCTVSEIIPLVPVYGTPTLPMKVAPGSGHAFKLRFEPNDLGKAAFHDEPLTLDGNDLVMSRFDSAIRFVHDRP